MAAVGVHHIQVILTAAIGGEDDLAIIGRPCWSPLVEGVVGETHLVAAIGVSDIHLGMGVRARIWTRVKGHLLARLRPGWIRVGHTVTDEASLEGAIGMHEREAGWQMWSRGTSSTARVGADLWMGVLREECAQRHHECETDDGWHQVRPAVV